MPPTSRTDRVVWIVAAPKNKEKRVRRRKERKKERRRKKGRQPQTIPTSASGSVPVMALYTQSESASSEPVQVIEVISIVSGDTL